jgi:hypothetical protein
MRTCKPANTRIMTMTCSLVREGPHISIPQRSDSNKNPELDTKTNGQVTPGRNVTLSQLVGELVSRETVN